MYYWIVHLLLLRPTLQANGNIVASIGISLPGSGTGDIWKSNLKHDPRMLADVGYLTDFPVDPIAQKQTWSVVRNKNHQVVGVHSLSNEAPTLFAPWFAFRGGAKYSN